MKLKFMNYDLQPDFCSSGLIFLAELTEESWWDLAAVKEGRVGGKKGDQKGEGRRWRKEGRSRE
jgi:hypothetical protein